MRRTLISVAFSALCLTGVLGGTATADPSPSTLPNGVTWFSAGQDDSCTPGAQYSICYFTGPKFTGDALGIPWGADDVLLNGRWHFRSLKAIDGFSVGWGPTDGTLRAQCSRWGKETGTVIQKADFTDELFGSEPFSVVGHYKSSVTDKTGLKAAVDCSPKAEDKPDADGWVRKNATL